MANLTNQIKGTLLISAGLILLCIVFSCKTQTVDVKHVDKYGYNTYIDSLGMDVTTNEYLYEITFARGFRHDKISFLVNDVPVLKEVYLTSDELLDLTPTWITIRQEQDNYQVESIITTKEGTQQKETQQIALDPEKINLKIRYKGKEFLYVLEKKNGQHLIIDGDKKKRELNFSQRKVRPDFN